MKDADKQNADLSYLLGKGVPGFDEAAGQSIKTKILQAEIDVCYAALERELQTADAEEFDVDILVETPLRPRATLELGDRNKPLLGIEIRESSLHIALIDVTGKIQFTQNIAWEKEIDAKKQDLIIIQAITKILTQHKIKITRAVICKSDDLTIIRTITLPKLDKIELKKAILFELKRLHLPIAEENLYLRYQILREDDKNQNTLLVVAADKTVVERTCRLLLRAGLKPVAVDVDVLALSRFLRRAFLIDEKDTTVLINMRPQYSEACILEQGILVWSKDIKCGTTIFRNGVNEANTRQLDSEIRRILQYYLQQHGDVVIDRILLSGNNVPYSQLCDELTNLLAIPVVTWSPAIGIDSSTTISEFAISLGLGLWHTKHDPINFLPKGKAAFWEQIDHLSHLLYRLDNSAIPKLKIPRLWVWPCAIYIIAVGLFLMGKLKIDKVWREELARQEFSLIKRFGARMDNEESQKIQEQVQMIEILSKARAQASGVADALAELSALVPLQMALNAIRFEKNLLQITGYASSEKNLEQFFQALATSYHFHHIEPKLIENNRTQASIYFELACQIRGHGNL